jgi:hypothetical protein
MLSLVRTTNSKPAGPIIMMDDSETLSEQQLDRIYYTLFLKVHIFAAPFTSRRKQCNYAEPKLFS